MPARADSPGSGRVDRTAHRHSAPDRAARVRRIAARPDTAPVPDTGVPDTGVPDTEARVRPVAQHSVAADGPGSAGNPARRHTAVQLAAAPAHSPAASTAAVRGK